MSRGLSRNQRVLLLALEARGARGLSTVALQQQLGVSRQSVSRALHSLERLGLVHAFGLEANHARLWVADVPRNSVLRSLTWAQA